MVGVCACAVSVGTAIRIDAAAKANTKSNVVILCVLFFISCILFSLNFLFFGQEAKLVYTVILGKANLELVGLACPILIWSDNPPNNTYEFW